ncbi:hypothetical protein H8D85_01675 [bacterium]|nr:hypothetical protein [bacterium]
MLELLSDINLVSRFDVDFDSETVTAVQGTFIEWDGTLPSAGAIGSNAVWTENRGSEWSPDHGATGKVSVLYGKYRAKTSEVGVSTSCAAGTPLYVDAAGKLTITDAGGSPVAIALGAPVTNYKYLGTDYAKVVEFVTI